MTVTRRAILAATTAGLGLGLLPASAHDGVTVLDAYARFLPGAKAGAIYLTIENHADVDEQLLSVHTDLADKAELHRSKMAADGMMTMEPLPDGLPIDPSGRITLVTGGDHIMVTGLKSHPRNGDMIALTLTFRHAGTVTLTLPVDNSR